MKVQFLDIGNAYLHAPVTRDIYIDLPAEDYEDGMCGKCVKCMYGTKDAAQNWEFYYTKILSELGFRQGKSNPCVFYNADKDVRTVIHGDDFTSIGDEDVLNWFYTELSQQLTVTCKGVLGPDVKDDKSVRILNRIVTYSDNEIRYEADQRHAEIIIS